MPELRRLGRAAFPAPHHAGQHHAVVSQAALSLPRVRPALLRHWCRQTATPRKL